MGFGIVNTRYVDLPPGIDESYLRGLETRSGLDLVDVVQLVDAAMGAINEGADDLVAMLTYRTTEAVAPTRRTTRKVVQAGGEYTVARSQIGENAGHMFGIRPYEISLEWTEDGIHRMSRARLTDELNDIVVAWQKLYRGEVLSRLFDPAEIKIDKGTSVKSPGFAGSGTGSNQFLGTYPNGAALPGGYTHYAVTTEANLATTLRTYRDRLLKWNRAPFDIIGSPGAIDRVASIEDGQRGFVSAGSALVRAAVGDREANVDPETYLGVFDGNLRVRQPVDEIGEDADTFWLAIVKSQGDFAAGNPLAWRYDELQGPDVYVRSRTMFPLADATSLQEFGINVANRASAALVMIDPAAVTYVAPTISF